MSEDFKNENFMGNTQAERETENDAASGMEKQAEKDAENQIEKQQASGIFGRGDAENGEQSGGAKAKAKTLSDPKKRSPMMEQYWQIRDQYPDCVLFYRLGDFYELFYEDAIEMSRVLDLTLTGKNCGLEERAPMCGVPYHAADEYIAKLVSLGYKVAICEQVGEVCKGQKTVDRQVVRVVTAGTVTDASTLDEKKNNYIMCLNLSGQVLNVVWCDITTGDMEQTTLDGQQGQDLVAAFSDLVTRVAPSQVIGNAPAKVFYNDLPVLRLGTLPKFEQYFDYAFSAEKAKQKVAAQFGQNAAAVFELSSGEICAVGALLEYISDTQKRALQNIMKISKIKNDQFMTIDSNTRRNLELVESIRERKKYGSLLWLLDKTKTSMGGRAFRKMFDQPLLSVVEINRRQECVQEFVQNLIMRDAVLDALGQVRDIERISGRIAYGNVTPVELVNFKTSLAQIPILYAALAGAKGKDLQQLREKLVPLDEIVSLLEKAIDPEASSLMKNGGYIRAGFNEELDSLRNAKQIANAQMRKLEELERQQTGIKNLKIKENSVFGLYIEVSNSQSELVPLRYVRKQTVKDAERYTTPDLKEIENRLYSADEDALKLEDKLFKMLLEYLCKFLERFLSVAKAIAEIDALCALAVAAVKYNFCRPKVSKNSGVINIVEGRHPIVENFVKDGGFIANDTLLDTDENQMMIITGPNMAGKSTYMRQVAIITFLAHIGSFVPAKSAEICVTDRIFTRVGASDDLAFGQSTFMVEMSEVANILANATEKSLVVLDEIGRGTSTFDGLSIAWAVVEYICKNLKCKTLFATHYHELSELEGVMKGVKNYKITVKELADTVVFLRKIVRGSANRSFGVEVARLAGVPEVVTDRAKEISLNLEKLNHKLDMNVFGQDEDVIRQDKNNKLGQQVLSILRDLDINRITPMESFEILADLIGRANKKL